MAYPNDSTVLRTDIGEIDAALLCTTDSTTCCSNVGGETRAGEFYFPSSSGGGVVPILGGVTNGYYRLRGSQHILLNRQPTGTITGQFRCNIPNAMGVMVDLFIDIGEYTFFSRFMINIKLVTLVDVNISVTASGTNTAGERYNLECSAIVTGSTGQPIITWLDPMNNTVPSGMVTTTGSMSTLTFNPLSASHAGTYTCRATLGGAIQNAVEVVTVASECLLIIFCIIRLSIRVCPSVHQ